MLPEETTGVVKSRGIQGLAIIATTLHRAAFSEDGLAIEALETRADPCSGRISKQLADPRRLATPEVRGKVDELREERQRGNGRVLGKGQSEDRLACIVGGKAWSIDPREDLESSQYTVFHDSSRIEERKNRITGELLSTKLSLSPGCTKNLMLHEVDRDSPGITNRICVASLPKIGASTFLP
ncbi:hypothetical protein KM043_002253 [Ampulex compressa]|nr:hypothetical protein KM043_002253 [Ampulex compressa]